MSGTFMDKSFSVGMAGNQQYRDNWDRIFKKTESKEPEPLIEPRSACSKCGPQEPHTCPYNEEINDDSESLCECCPCAEHECLMDI